MGCDIHLHLQVKDEKGEWQWLPKPRPAGVDRKTSYREPLTDRNYELFGVLAGVRGGGDRIANPRGLPPGVRNASDEEFEAHIASDVEHREDFLEFGDHSHSWLTYREIVDYPHWGLPGQRSAYVVGERYLKEFQCVEYKDREEPGAFFTDVQGEEAYTIDEDDWAEACGPDEVYVKVSWPHKDDSYAQGFLDRLAECSQGRDPKDCRIVFGFDS